MDTHGRCVVVAVVKRKVAIFRRLPRTISASLDAAACLSRVFSTPPLRRRSALSLRSFDIDLHPSPTRYTTTTISTPQASTRTSPPTSPLSYCQCHIFLDWFLMAFVSPLKPRDNDGNSGAFWELPLPLRADRGHS